MADRRIIVMEGDKTVYEGPEQRHTHNVAMIQAPRLFGLSPDTWVKVAGFLFAVALFYYRTDDFMKAQTETNKYLVKFVQNSDAYHSALTGQEFEQGRPSGRVYGRKDFNINATAYAADNKQEIQQ